MCALGWQSYVPAASNVCATALQGFAVVASDSYVPETWHVALLTILVCSFAILFNVYLARKLPGIEAAVFTLYALAFVAFFIILLAMGSRSGVKTMFTHFEDNANWGSIGTACFVGVSGPVITLIGSDSAVHMAEELKNASRQLPKVMLFTAAVNYLLGFLMLIAFIAVVGDVAAVLESPTGSPYIQVIWNATQSRTATMVMVAFIVFFFIFGSVNSNTTSSRQLYAFARDGGLPFSRWISFVRLFYRQLIKAVMLTNSKGLTDQERTCARRLSHLADRLWACPDSPWLNSCFSQHPDHRQLGAHLVVLDLCRFSTLSPQYYQSLRQAG